MGLPGTSPRWREVEARLRPPSVRPTFQVVHRPDVPKKPDKVAVCERFCAKKHVFLEIKLILAQRRIANLTALPKDVLPIRFTAREIVHAIAEKHELTYRDLLSEIRSRPFVRARQEACYEIARLTHLSLPAIGKAMGGRDHTTIMHAIRAHIALGAPAIREMLPLGQRKERSLSVPQVPRTVRRRVFWAGERMERLYELMEAGMSDAEIGQVMGHSADAIRSARKRDRNSRIASQSNRLRTGNGP